MGNLYTTAKIITNNIGCESEEFEVFVRKESVEFDDDNDCYCIYDSYVDYFIEDNLEMDNIIKEKYESQGESVSLYYCYTNEKYMVVTETYHEGRFDTFKWVKDLKELEEIADYYTGDQYDELFENMKEHMAEMMLENAIEDIKEKVEFKVIGKEFSPFYKKDEYEGLEDWECNLAEDVERFRMELLNRLGGEEYESYDENFGNITEFVTISLEIPLDMDEEYFYSFTNRRILEITKTHWLDGANEETIEVSANIY